MTTIDAPSPPDGGERPGGPEVRVTCYTDPLCAWSWALEPHARRLRLEFGGRLAWRNVLAGLIADWDGYDDPLNDVRRPAQMGPHWYHVGQAAGMPIDPALWHEDPPASSYPACLAVKAAGLQGEAAGEAYLRRLREAAMLRRRNVARTDVLLDVAAEVAADLPASAFAPGRFRDDLIGTGARDALGADLLDVKDRAARRFPTLVLRRVGGPGLIVTGYRPYEALAEAMARAAPDVRAVRSAADPAEFVRAWGRALDCEVAVALGLDLDAVRRSLDQAVEAGALRRDPSLSGGYRR